MHYCIYSNTILEDNETNEEHIFPLTLGGHDQFTIRVSKKANTRANKELDEKIKSCFFLARNRKINESKGHRNKQPSPPMIKIISGFDKSIALKFDENDYLHFYSHKKNKILTSDDIRSENFSFSIKYERYARLRFAAKIALASGYFIYGDIFIKNVKTEELRAIMNCSGELHDDDDFNQLTTTGWFWPELINDSDKLNHRVFQAINDMFKVSFVALITCWLPDKVLIVVGVLGELTGVISCPANCEMFPKTADYDLGHVVVLKKEGIQRFSYRSCLQQLMTNLLESG